MNKDLNKINKANAYSYLEYYSQYLFINSKQITHFY